MTYFFAHDTKSESDATFRVQQLKENKFHVIWTIGGDKHQQVVTATDIKQLGLEKTILTPKNLEAVSSSPKTPQVDQTSFQLLDVINRIITNPDESDKDKNGYVNVGPVTIEEYRMGKRQPSIHPSK